MSTRHPFIQSFILILTIFSAFLASLSPIRHYYLEIIAFLSLVYIILRRLLLPRLSQHRQGLLFAILFSFIVMYTVLSSGGLNSAYFFLIYFLLFALSIMTNPVVSLIEALAIMCMLISQLEPNPGYQQLMPLIALPFLVPFALFLGNEHRALIQERSASEQNQTDIYLFLSVVIKGHLNSLDEIVTQFKGDHDLDRMNKILRRTKQLIDAYEKNSS